ASAVGAGGVAAILREEDANVQLVLLALEGFEEAADAGPGTAAVVDETLLGFGEVVPGNVGGDAFGLGGALHLGVPGRAVFRFRPWVDRAGVKGLGAVGDDEVGVEVDGVTEALAAWAGAVGVVEAEEARLGFAVGA